MTWARYWSWSAVNSKIICRIFRWKINVFLWLIKLFFCGFVHWNISVVSQLPIYLIGQSHFFVRFPLEYYTRSRIQGIKLVLHHGIALFSQQKVLINKRLNTAKSDCLCFMFFWPCNKLSLNHPSSQLKWFLPNYRENNWERHSGHNVVQADRGAGEP